MLKAGDRVYYHVWAGWGHGQRFRLFAIVQAVREKNADVILWNELRQCRETKYYVSLSNLSKRDASCAALDDDQ